MPHKIVKMVTTGSVGDLGRIARALASANPPLDIATIGGGEGLVGNQEVGIISMAIRNDDGRDAEILDIVSNVDLGSGRRFESVEAHPALIVELNDEPGSLADCAERLGNEDINIMGVVLLDLHGAGAHVGFGFADDTEQDRARAALDGFFTIIDDHDH